MKTLSHFLTVVCVLGCANFVQSAEPPTLPDRSSFVRPGGLIVELEEAAEYPRLRIPRWWVSGEFANGTYRGMTLTAGLFLAISAAFFGLWWARRGKGSIAGTTGAVIIGLLSAGVGVSAALANSSPMGPRLGAHQFMVGEVIVEVVNEQDVERRNLIVLVANQADLANIRDRIDEKLGKPAVKP